MIRNGIVYGHRWLLPTTTQVTASTFAQILLVGVAGVGCDLPEAVACLLQVYVETLRLPLDRTGFTSLVGGW